MSAALPEELSLLAWLIGTWRGEGFGDYPTIEHFRYGEELRFWHTGQMFLAYSQATWSIPGGTPMHSEVGFFRPQRDGSVEIVLAHPTGVVEIEEGRIDGHTITVSSMTVATSSSATPVQALARRITLEDDVLTYVLEMQAVGQPLREHLSASLRRDAD